MNATEIIMSIIQGDADDNLRGIMEVCRDREKTVARGVFFTLKAGDRVRFTGGQKYLIGSEGTIREKRQTKVVVDLDRPVGKYHRGVISPVELLEKV